MATRISKIPVGISSCLLGQTVRFDGGHKFDTFINNHMGRFMEFLPYCPEVAIGLGVPRHPLRIVRENDGIRLRGSQDPTLDVTEKLQRYGRKIGNHASRFCGYIFKAGSPSCGMVNVQTYNNKGLPLKADGTGAFANQIMLAQPNMPVEEEGRLNDPGLRENFIERIFTYYRWKQIKSRRLSPARLTDFHQRHRLAIMAHNQAACRRLGKMIADIEQHNIKTLADEYETELMTTLKKQATRKSHGNILQYLQGRISKSLGNTDQLELTRLIEDYHTGLVPLIAPLTLIRHHLLHHPDERIMHQTYLQSWPQELT